MAQFMWKTQTISRVTHGVATPRGVGEVAKWCSTFLVFFFSLSDTYFPIHVSQDQIEMALMHQISISIIMYDQNYMYVGARVNFIMTLLRV